MGAKQRTLLAIPLALAMAGGSFWLSFAHSKEPQEPSTTVSPRSPAENRTHLVVDEVARRDVGVNQVRSTLARGLHPRDPSEWQGMLVNLDAMALCDTSARCGLAMACRNGKCGPCADDSECVAQEACVMDHCVPKQNLRCKTRRDCSADELCILSGYTSDPRGNREMFARCQSTSGQAAAPEATELVLGVSPSAPEVQGSELLEQARRAQRGEQ